MKSSELIALMISNASLTKNIRIYEGDWIISSHLFPEAVARKVGSIISLLQNILDRTRIICDKNNEYLLILNLEPVAMLDSGIYGLTTLVRPIEKINVTNENMGRPVIFYINTKTWEVMNGIKTLIDLGCMTKDDVIEENKRTGSTETAISYGFYNQFSALSCFVSISSNNPIDVKDIFMGKYDKSEILQKAVAFDSLSEAQEYFHNSTAVGLYIFELPYPATQLLRIIDRGIGNEIVKIIDCRTKKVMLTPHVETLKKIPAAETQAQLVQETLVPTTASAELTVNDAVAAALTAASIIPAPKH